MFDNLKALLQRGDAAIPVAPAPKRVDATPAPKPAPEVEAAPAVAPDNSGISKAAPAEAVTVPAAAPVPAKAVVPEHVRDLNREDCPADPATEAREDLPPRSRERIAWLLQNYETTPQMTKARIFNDKMRWRNANPPVTVSPYREPNRNPQAHLVSPEK